MWIANDWKEYEVIDTSCGEKLERWGKYTLVRPDPQVIWDTPKISRGWKNMNAHYHRSKKGGGEWEFFDLPQHLGRFKQISTSSAMSVLPANRIKPSLISSLYTVNLRTDIVLALLIKDRKSSPGII